MTTAPPTPPALRATLLGLGLLLMAMLAALAPAPLHAQDQPQRETRVNRLREHERKIREIIEAQRERRRQQESEAPPADEPPPPEEVVEQTKRAASSVVLGLKFINEEGVADYSLIARDGDTFVTEVMMFNIDQNEIDRVRLAIRYDKRFIEPLRLFDTALRPFVRGEPRFVLDEQRAIISYDATLQQPLTQPETVLLRILWGTRRPTPFTGIEFAFSPEERDDQYHTAMYVRGNNILGVASDPADGVLSGGLMIEQPPSPVTGERVLQGKAEELRQIYLGSVASDQAVGLRLLAPSEPVRLGEDFIVQVGLNNPEGALIDSLSFCVLFDPRVLRVIDQDKFNWIRRGVNVHDGPFQSRFPWDMHKQNQVRNDRGLISYQMSLSNGASLPSEVFAQIRFRAIAPSTGTAISFHKGRTSDPAHSSVRYFGFERLKLEAPLSEPVKTIVVLNESVLPPAVADPGTTAGAAPVPAGPLAPAPVADASIRPLPIER
jgi:hypothetical protein